MGVARAAVEGVPRGGSQLWHRGGVRHGHPYQACYCEENIWQLALRLGDPAAEVCFITNADSTVAMWEQRAAPEGEPLVWDYHVVLVRPRPEGWQVLDLDSRLPFPCPVETWLERSFQPSLGVVPDLRPRFRVMRTDEYLSRFSSDRSHMRGPDGTWAAPPPPWPPILQGANTLEMLRNSSTTGPGIVLDLEGLRRRYGRKTAVPAR